MDKDAFLTQELFGIWEHSVILLRSILMVSFVLWNSCSRRTGHNTPIFSYNTNHQSSQVSSFGFVGRTTEHGTDTTTFSRCFAVFHLAKRPWTTGGWSYSLGGIVWAEAATAYFGDGLGVELDVTNLLLRNCSNLQYLFPSETRKAWKEGIRCSANMLDVVCCSSQNFLFFENRNCATLLHKKNVLQAFK